MKADLAIIGGTGVADRLARLGGRPILVPTIDGPMRGKVVDWDGRTVVLLQRHSAGHKVPPHRVNYRAMARGLATLGVRACYATAAVGSLRTDWDAGTLVAPSDFYDVTGRNLTLFDRAVQHTDFTDPFPARSGLLAAAQKCGIPVNDGGVYVCANGPRYETPHEVQQYGHVGDIVGMTAASEAIVMREAGVPYGCLAVVTNLGTGLSDVPLAHGDVTAAMEKSGELAVRILRALAT